MTNTLVKFRYIVSKLKPKITKKQIEKFIPSKSKNIQGKIMIRKRLYSL